MSEYDAYMAGVPDVRSSGGRSIFVDSPVSSRGQYALSTNRMAATGAIMEARDRMDQFRANQRARAQAPRAIQEISQLDPANDPDYDARVADVFARYPDAGVDRSVQNFLGVQGDIWNRSQSQRIAEQRQEERMAAQEAEHRYREAQAMRAKSQARRTAREKERDALVERTASLPPEAQRSVADGVDFGFAPEEALGMVETSLKTDEEINQLIEMGIPEEEIMGRESPDGTFQGGIIGADKRIDPRKQARLVAQFKSAPKDEERTWKIGASDYTLRDLARFYDAPDGTNDLGLPVPNPIRAFVDQDPMLKEAVAEAMAAPVASDEVTDEAAVSSPASAAPAPPPRPHPALRFYGRK